MRRAAADALRTPPELALIANVPRSDLMVATPVVLQPIDSFSEPEPSEGATIELASGRHVVVIYGLSTARLSVHAAWPDAPQSVADFLHESGLRPADIEWIDPRVALLVPADVRPTVSARR
jgi:hypothetical protein